MQAADEKLIINELGPKLSSSLITSFQSYHPPAKGRVWGKSLHGSVLSTGVLLLVLMNTTSSFYNVIGHLF